MNSCIYSTSSPITVEGKVMASRPLDVCNIPIKQKKKHCLTISSHLIWPKEISSIRNTLLIGKPTIKAARKVTFPFLDYAASYLEITKGCNNLSQSEPKFFFCHSFYSFHMNKRPQTTFSLVSNITTYNYICWHHIFYHEVSTMIITISLKFMHKTIFESILHSI